MSKPLLVNGRIHISVNSSELRACLSASRKKRCLAVPEKAYFYSSSSFIVLVVGWTDRSL
jgi:hypothetical protein